MLVIPVLGAGRQRQEDCLVLKSMWVYILILPCPENPITCVKLKHLLKVFMCMSVCVPQVCPHKSEKASDPLEQKQQRVVSHHCFTELEPRSSVRALDLRAISPVPIYTQLKHYINTDMEN